MKQNYITLKHWIALAFTVLLFSLGVSGQTTLMHSYTFEDGTANDGTGTLHGTLNGLVTIADGKATVGPEANGQGQDYGYISFNGTDLALSSYPSITLEAMIEASNGDNDSFTMLYYFGDDMADYLFAQMTVGANDESAVKTITGDGEAVVSYKRIDDGAKHHIVAVLTSTSLSYYVDGDSIGTATGTGFITPIGTAFANLFRGPDGWNDDNWIGSFEEFNIYEGAMDSETVGDRASAYLSSSDARLSALEVDPGTMSPAFDAAVTRYHVVVPEGTTSVTITSTTRVSNATYTGGGTIDVSSGTAVDTIEVTSEDGTNTMEYIVSIGVVNTPDAATVTHSYLFNDGTADDAVGNVHGVLNEGATVSGGSLVLADGQSVSLDGKAIDLPSYDAVTVEAWYTPEGATNTGFHTIYSFGSNRDGWMGVDYFQYQPAREDDVSRLAISCKNYADPWVTENGINTVETDDATMHHAVGIMTDDGITLYVDGEYIGYTAYTGNNHRDSVSSDTVFFGKSVYYLDPTWKGSIEEVNIYSTALHPGEVAYQYQNGPVSAPEKADITFIVDDSKQAAATGFALKGSWDTATGEYDDAWSGGAEHSDFYDDGTHGDVTAGDHIWTVTIALVPDGGANTWEWGVNDADGNWIDGNFQFTVPDATDQTLDPFVIPNNDATLSALSVDPGTLSPSFASETTSYTAEAPEGTTSVTVSATPTDSNANISGDGDIDVSSGSATANVVVTAEDGSTTETYTIDITVLVNIEDMNLSSMKVYPTVSSGMFNIEFSGTPGSIEVLSMTGKTVLYKKAQNARETIQIENAGIYIVRLEAEGVSKMVKIIKTK